MWVPMCAAAIAGLYSLVKYRVSLHKRCVSNYWLELGQLALETMLLPSEVVEYTD